MKNSSYKYIFVSLIFIFIDQAIKLWMHFDVLPNHFGEIEIVPNFFKLHYVENAGMAFGMEIGGKFGKLILTTFRIFAMVGICWYLVSLTKKQAHNGLLWSISAILAGAIGNLIDSVFYGVFLKNALHNAPTAWLHGQVIDMFYVNALEGHYPDWLPFIGGTEISTYIFNFADACIFCGVVSILIFQKKFFGYNFQAKSTLIEQTI